MSAPGVGALVALTYRSAVDDPARFEKSSTVGAYFGLTPKKYQSGETDRDGGVSKVGDAMVRTALFESAHIMLTRASIRLASDEVPSLGRRLGKVVCSAVTASAKHAS
jgi:transposase